jgi:hypothetical protein
MIKLVQFNYDYWKKVILKTQFKKIDTLLILIGFNLRIIPVKKKCSACFPYHFKLNLLNLHTKNDKILSDIFWRYVVRRNN